MKFERLPTDCDFSETAADDAAAHLGVALKDVRVYITDEWRIRARQLQSVHGFDVTIIPRDFAVSRFAWAVAANGRMLGSRGCD